MLDGILHSILSKQALAYNRLSGTRRAASDNI